MKTNNWKRGSLAVLMLLVGMLSQAQQNSGVGRQEVRLHKEVFYEIRQSDNDPRSAGLREVAEFMKTHEDVTINIVGYADKGTGNAKLNQMYAQRRAQQFKDDLVKIYGVEANRISTDSKGDLLQPFSENDKNRCVLVEGVGYLPQKAVEQTQTAKNNADEQRRQYQEDRDRRYAEAMGKTDTVYVTLTDTVWMSAPEERLHPESPFGLNKSHRWRNWFVQAGIGPAIYQGDHNEDADYGDRIYKALNFSVGKWIYPAFGVRAGFDLDMVKMMYGLNAPAGYHFDGNYEPNPRLKKMAFNAWNFRADAMLNLSSFMWSPYQKRIINIIPYLGLGYMAVWDEPFEYSLSLNAGVMASLRLAECLDLNLDLRVKKFDDELNAYKQGHHQDGISNLTIGLTWYFTERGF